MNFTSFRFLKLKLFRVLSRRLKINTYHKILKGDLKGYKFLINPLDNSYFNGEYERDSFFYVVSEIIKTPELVIYDMGANIGYFSLLCSAVSQQKAKIFAFEPIPENMTILCRHLTINNTQNIFPVNLAVSDHLGIVDFSANNSSVSYTYLQSSNYYGDKNINIKTAVMSLDVLIEQYGFSAPAIIKIDVEGAEYDVLIGCANSIKKFHPKILLSTHEPHQQGIENKCLAFLDAANYVYKKIPNDPYRMKGLNDYWCTSK